MNIKNSTALYKKAQQLIPGGVNSPVRSFKSVGGSPLFISSALGAHLTDADGNRFIDFVLSWGPLVLGHAHPDVVDAIKSAVDRGTSYGAPTAIENELAELVIDTVPSIEMIRFVNSGTEATMSALRLARAYTDRSRIIKFAGCYHGHADMLLVQAGSGVASLGLPDSPGVPAGTAADTITVPYNNVHALRGVFDDCGKDIAAVIVEPIGSNMGFVLPRPGFLSAIRHLCTEHGALFILDEVMTGFRVAPGGAQELWNLDPDLTCLGKVIGGGLPVGAYAGKREIMMTVAPAGPMYQAGTLSGNPLAMAAGLATIRGLLDAGLFESMTRCAEMLVSEFKIAATAAGVPVQTAQVGTMFGIYFLKPERATEQASSDLPTIHDFDTARKFADTERYSSFFHGMLEEGCYFAPSQFEAGFVSSAHTKTDIADTIKAAARVLTSIG